MAPVKYRYTYKLVFDSCGFDLLHFIENCFRDSEKILINFQAGKPENHRHHISNRNRTCPQGRKAYGGQPEMGESKGDADNGQTKGYPG